MTEPRVILIVEDNPRNLMLVRNVLSFNGYGTLEAPNAEEGIALARTHQPDLVLMDVQLPGMGGVEALRVLRAEPSTAALRVVALTAFAMKDDRAKYLADGFDGYLAKPLSVRELPGQVESLMASEKGARV